MNADFRRNLAESTIVAISLAAGSAVLPDSVLAASNLADLDLTVVDAPDPVLLNGELTYSFTVRNQGQKKAKGVKLIHTLPRQSVDLLGTSRNCKKRLLKKSITLTCKLGNLSGGASVVQAVKVRPKVEGNIVTDARVSSTTRDAKKANNALTTATRSATHINQRPSASNLSIGADTSQTTMEVTLIGTDPDHDTVGFELLSPASGTGYTQAYIQGGKLYVTLAPGFVGAITLVYRATDGQDFSDPATVAINVRAVESATEKGTGLVFVDPQRLAQTRDVTKGFVLSAARGDSEASIPTAVDLSGDFPQPRDQGRLGSCVAWAAGFALKTYQEREEVGWDINSNDHVFSPAYIFNQIKLDPEGQNGSYIFDAFQLMQNQGVSTWTSMPYSDADPTTQPSPEARLEASYYKAAPGNIGRPASRDTIKALLTAKKPQPVTVGILLFENFRRLLGRDAVYNSASGAFIGGHAVTIVGFDDNRYGGAYKIINSWGTDFGDNGYFWLPYAFAESTVSVSTEGQQFQSPILAEAYTLEDGENTAPVDPNSPPPGNLPNLQVEKWTASYTPVPGGDFKLTWSVINTGAADAPAGADVNFMLSRDDHIDYDDIYVFYEEIPSKVDKSGGKAYRDDSNPIRFNFPDWVSGEYYMAVWVDDLEEVAESNEGDNLSWGENKVNLASATPEPDLAITQWNADWDAYGNGVFTFDVLNQGNAAAPAGWYVNLVLSSNADIGDGDEHFLYWEKVSSVLSPGYRFYRNGASAAYFNLNLEQWGDAVPAGYYYMGVWVDDTEVVAESNEINNVSLGSNLACVDGGSLWCWYYGATPDGTVADANSTAHPSRSASGQSVPSSAHNGKHGAPPNVALRKVRISEDPEGRKTIELLDQPDAAEVQPQVEPVYSKTMSSEDTVLYPPLGEAVPMPAAQGSRK